VWPYNDLKLKFKNKLKKTKQVSKQWKKFIKFVNNQQTNLKYQTLKNKSTIFFFK
jgi:hypothetical protein